MPEGHSLRLSVLRVHAERDEHVDRVRVLLGLEILLQK
jgi:hypothetical protein